MKLNFDIILRFLSEEKISTNLEVGFCIKVLLFFIVNMAVARFLLVGGGDKLRQYKFINQNYYTWRFRKVIGFDKILVLPTISSS